MTLTRLIASLYNMNFYTGCTNVYVEKSEDITVARKVSSCCFITFFNSLWYAIYVVKI